jgi:glycosyltransferase involved in cell wall biosynthesis
MKLFSLLQNMSPKISVVTPTYNRAHVLPRAIESVQRQTIDNYEHIIVDDASTDDTEAVVEPYGESDSRVRYCKLKTNLGNAGARNKALELAEGEYISFLDSDDEYTPKRLERTVDTLEALPAEFGGVCHPFSRVFEDNERIGTCQTGRITLADLCKRNVIGGLSNTIYRKTVCEQVGGFDKSLRSAVDYDFQLRVAEQYDHHGVNETLCLYYESEAGVQDNPEKIKQGLKRLTEKHRDHLSPRNLSRQYLRIGSASLEFDSVDEASKWFERSLNTEEAAIDANHDIGRNYLAHNYKRTSRQYLLAHLDENWTDYRTYILFALTFVPFNGRESIELSRSVRDGIAERIP